METGYIRIFLALAETGSLADAAERLFMSQSTLSRQLKQLEESLGVPLFTRTARRMGISEQGRAFLPYAEKIVALERAYFSEHPGGAAAKVTVGLSGHLDVYGVDRLLERFRAQHPAVLVETVHDLTPRLEQLVADGACDCAFVRTVGEGDARFLAKNIATDALVVMMPNEHPLAGRGCLAIGDLREEPLLVLAEYEALLRRTCLSAGFEPLIALVSLRTRNLMEMLTRGMGISLHAERFAREKRTDAITCLPIVPGRAMSIDLIRSREREPSGGLWRLLRFLEATPLVDPERVP